MDARAAGGQLSVRDRLSALSSLLMLAAGQDDQASLVQVVAGAVEKIGPCRAEAMLLGGQWQDIPTADNMPSRTDVGSVVLSADGGRVELVGVSWAWAYPMPDPYGTTGYLVVGSAREPAEHDLFLLQVLALGAGAALANARLSSRERQQAAELRLANRALQRSRQIHDRLTQVARGGESQDGLARAVHELTQFPTAIEDRFGNLRAWAGPAALTPIPRTIRGAGTRCCGVR